MAAETSSQAAIGGSFDSIRIPLDTQKSRRHYLRCQGVITKRNNVQRINFFCCCRWNIFDFLVVGLQWAEEALTSVR